MKKQDDTIKAQEETNELLHQLVQLKRRKYEFEYGIDFLEDEQFFKFPLKVTLTGV